MKLLIFLIPIFITTNLNSQDLSYNIYILLETNSDLEKIEIKNDTLTYEIFKLKNQLNPISKNYIITKDRKLSTEIVIKTEQTNRYISLVYENRNYTNNPFVKKVIEIDNLISYPSDFVGVKLDNIYQILKNSNQIYLVQFIDELGFATIKTVKLKE